MKNWLVKQNNSSDCGVACISSVIRYYNGNIPHELIRKELNITNVGCSAYDIVKTLNKYGFDAYGAKVCTNDLGNVHLPAIAHVCIDNKYLHFVVIYKITKNYILIMDPAKGMTKLKYDNWRSIYKETIILLNPTQPLISINNEKSIKNVIFKCFIDEKHVCLRMLYISIILYITNILATLYLKFSLNIINVENTFFNYKTTILLFSVITFMKIATLFTRNYYEIYLNKKVSFKVNWPFIKHIFSIPLYSFKSRKNGEVVTRIFELDNIKDNFGSMLVSMLLDLLLAFCALTMLLIINYKLSFILIIIVVVYVFVSLIFSKSITKKVKLAIESETKYNEKLLEYLSGIVSIKNTSNKYFLKSLEEYFITTTKISVKLKMFLNLIDVLKNIVYEFGILIINFLAIKMIMEGKLFLTDLIVFNSVLVYAFTPVKAIIDNLPKLFIIGESFNRINEILNIDEDDKESKSPNINFGKITINNLSYSYNKNHHILKDINAEIKCGDKVLIKGKSGSGKSTLCKLICRQLDTFEGNILIDDVNLLDYSFNDIKEHITYLSQDEVLFFDTIKNNILFEEDISVSKWQKICEICQLEDIVKDKPFRYDSYILECGSNLSGGEKQRVILARVLARKTNILILDEALSEVSLDMEQKIVADINKYFNNKTILYISHREINGFTKTLNVGETS